MAAIAQLQHGIAARNLVGVEAYAAREYNKRQQNMSPASPTAAPITTTSVDNAAAVSTLLSAYLSANPSLHSDNAEIISLISSFALAQEAYNSALERGETPPPPVLAIPGNTATSTLTAIPTGSGNSGSTVNRTSTGTTTSRSTTAPASPTGATTKYGAGKMMVVALCGVMAVLAIAA